MKILTKLFAALMLGSVLTHAATHTVTVMTSAGVQAKLDEATEANAVVVIPAGTITAMSQMTWTAPTGATLIGAGTTATGGGDVTTIVDNYNSSQPLLVIAAAATGTFRMSGFTLQVSIADPVKENGIIVIYGPGTVRVDHMHFDNHTVTANAKPVFFTGLIYGVVDHCIMDYHANSAIYITNGSGVDTQGNATWAAPTAFGGPNFLFFEDNLYRATTDASIRLADAWSASRVVWRFNTINGGSGFEVHATGHAGDDRGVRAMEGYGNSFTALADLANPPFVMAGFGSGTALMWGNANEPENLKNMFSFSVTRRYSGTYPQPPTPTGWGYVGPVPLATGTVNVSGTAVTWVSGDHFSTSWPVGTMIYITGMTAEGVSGQEPADGPAGGIFSVNSTTSITLANGGHTGSALTGVTYYTGSAWDGNTNAYGYPAIDQPGRGQGDLLVGSFPNKTNNTTGTISYPNQALEPIYIWKNTGLTPNSGHGGAVYSNSAPGLIVANRDYYPQASGVQTSPTSPFDGTVGVGWGTLANRPTTCTAGVAYWATDQGSWNQSTSNPYGAQQNGADGVLYKATATNTWTLYYEPYTYPHPLQGNAANLNAVRINVTTLRIGN